MKKLTVNILLGVLIGFSAATTQANDSISATVAQVVSLGPGPVINPENSLYIEEKKAAMVKQVQHYQAKQIKRRGKKNKHHRKIATDS
ncbi:hypothetical protein D3C79_128730 [compost metagenome]